MPKAKIFLTSVVVFITASCVKKKTPVTNTGGSPVELSEINKKLDANKGIIDDRDVERLKQFTSDAKSTTRANALTSLSYVKNPNAKEISIQCSKSRLSDADELVRHAALNALRRVGAPDIKDVAKRLENDPSLIVREAAHKILSNP